MLAAPALLTLGLAIGVWWWTPLYDRRPTLRLLATLTILSVLIVWLQILLGLFRSLTATNLRLATLSLIVVLYAGYWSWGRRFLVAKRDPIAPPSKLGLILGFVVVLVYAWPVFVGTLITPTGWDSLTYHLTQIFHMAQSRSVEVFPLLPGRGIQFYFPHAGEYHASWAYILSGAGAESYRVAGYGLMWMTLTFAVAARAAVEALGLRVALPLIVPAIMLTPALMPQALELYVDVAFAAFIVAGVAFGLWAGRESRFAHLVFTALAAGVALGVKVSFLYFSLPIFGVLLCSGVFRAITSGGARRAALRIAALLLVFSLGFGFWMGRNFIRTGNPFWPTRLAVGGLTIFDGPAEVPHGAQTKWYVSSQWDWFVYPFHETHRGVTRYNGNGFGPIFAAGYVSLFLLLPASIFYANWMLFRALMAFPLTIAPFVTISPTSEPRYAQALIGFAMIALAAAIEVIARGWRAALSDEPVVTPVRKRGPLALAGVAMAVALLFASLGSVTATAEEMDTVISRWRSGEWEPQQYYRLKYGPAGEAFNWIGEHGGKNVTFTFTNSTFLAPMFGWHNQNRVTHAAIPGDPKVGGRYRVSSYDGWRRFLRDQKVDYIVTWIPWWGETSDRLTEAWMEENPEDFALVEDFGGRTKVYRPVYSNRPRKPSVRPALAGMDSAKRWKLEYKTEGVATSVAGEDAIRFTYSFKTKENDYCDWRSRLMCDDWSDALQLSFDITAPAQATYLIIYLKNSETSEACRFRVDLRTMTGATQRVSFPLFLPEWRTKDFDLSDVCEIHVVLDDIDNSTGPQGTLTLDNFRLDEPTEAGGTP